MVLLLFSTTQPVLFDLFADFNNSTRVLLLKGTLRTLEGVLVAFTPYPDSVQLPVEYVHSLENHQEIQYLPRSMLIILVIVTLC